MSGPFVAGVVVLVVLVATTTLLISWRRQSSGYVVLLLHGRDRAVSAVLSCLVTSSLFVAFQWPTVTTVTTAAVIVVAAIVPIAWRWQHNRVFEDPRCGRSRAQRWSDAARMLYCAGLFTATALLGMNDGVGASGSTVFGAVFFAVALAWATVLVAKPERCPTAVMAVTTPGWYSDLCFEGRRFWNGSRWVDPPGRDRKYRLVGAYWLAWAVPLAMFGWFAWQEQVLGALLALGVTTGVLVGAGIVLTLHPLPRSPREDVPPVLPPVQRAYPGWFPESVKDRADATAPQLRWWDGNEWTSWTYSADRI